LGRREASLQPKFCFKKWQFFSTIMKIRQAAGAVGGELEARLLQI